MKSVTKLEISKYFENQKEFFVSPDLQDAVIEIVKGEYFIYGQGAFACIAKATVFREGESRNVAIRLMMADQPDLAARYQKLAELSSNEKLAGYLLNVEFREKEVREEPDESPVRPAILLDWADGISLAKFVSRSCSEFNVSNLKNLRLALRKLRLDLWSDGFAHGDLSGQNILVETNFAGIHLRLIDYDSVWFEDISSLKCPVGTTPLAHPMRQSTIGRHGDLMAFGIIDLALAFLIRHPEYGIEKGLFESGKFVFDVEDLRNDIGVVREIQTNEDLRGYCAELQNYARGPEVIDPSFLEIHFKETYGSEEISTNEIWLRSIPDFKLRLEKLKAITALTPEVAAMQPPELAQTSIHLFQNIVSGKEFGSFGSQMCFWDDARKLIERHNGVSGNWRLPTVVELNDFATDKQLKDRIGSDFYWTVRSKNDSANKDLHYRMRFNPKPEGYYSGSDFKAYVIGVRSLFEKPPRTFDPVAPAKGSPSTIAESVELNIHNWLIDQPLIRKLESVYPVSRIEMVREILTAIFSMENSEIALSSGIDISTLGTILANLPIDKSGKPEKLHIEVKNVVLQLNQKTRVLGLKLESDNLKVRAELKR
jgi:hypothetical protein